MKWLNRGGDGPQAIAFFAVLVVFTFAPLTSNAASGTLENWWCTATDFFGLPLCEQAPSVAVEASLPQAAEISDPVAVVAHTTVVEKFNTHVIEPASVITEGLVLGISNFVSLDSFRRQADAALGSAAKSARSVGSDMQAAQDGIKEQVTTVARTVSGTVNGAGTLVAGSLSASTPLASGAVSGTLGHWWCTATDFLGLSLCGEAPSLVVVVPQSQPVQTPAPAPEPSAVHTTVVEQHNTYVTKPTTIVRETSARANSEVVSPDSFHRQVDVVFDNVADSLRGVRDDIQAVRTDIAESVITAVLEVSGNANVGGNLDVTGTLTAGSLSVSSVSSGGVVEAPYFTATSSTASTLPYASTTAITVSGTASTTNLIANNFTLGSVTGFLKATAGVVATSLINLASDVTGVLAAVNGGTGLSTIANNQLLIGGAGNTFTQIATSSLGLITTDVAEGSNLYYTTTRFDNRLSATTTLPNLTTLANLTTVSTGLTGILKATSGALSAVSTLVPGDISLTKGNFLVGNDAGVAQATSSIFISSTGNVGIGSTVPDALLDIVGTTASPKSLLRVEQYATAVGAYGLEIHTYADNGAAPTPGAGAQSGLVIHNYTDAAPAMIIDQTRSTPLLLLRNSANPLTSSGTKGTGSFLDFAGYGLTDPNTLTDLGQISNHLSFSSYDPLVKWTFATGLDVSTGLRASITTAGAPDTTGTSETNNILRLLSGSTAVSMDMGVNNSPAYSWLQSRARTNYATNYSLVLNPNGGNVGVGTTSPASTLGVQGNGLFSGNLAVAGLTATGTVTFSGLSTGIAHLSSTGVLSSSAVALGGSDVTGTLTVANGGTGATTLTGLLQGNGTSAITAVTGTAGQFPYYNGTNTLLATSTLFVSTASSVGIGLTSPSARLNVKSAAANNLGGFMLTASGSSNYPVLIFENSSNGGQIELRDGSNVLATRITTNADSYITGGNVGIGTTSPTQLLHVYGSTPFINITPSSTGQLSGVRLTDSANSGKGGFYYDATNDLLRFARSISTSATNGLAIDSSGNVGIGTIAPQWQQEISGTGQNTSAIADSGDKTGALLLRSRNNGVDSGGALIFAGNNTAGAYFGAIKGLLADGTSQTLGSIAFSTRATTGATALTERMRVNYDGNVGIGSTNPSWKLTIATAAATPVRSLDISGSTTGFNYASMSNTSGSLWWGVEGSSAGQIFSGSLAYASVIGSSNATALQLASNGTVRMTLDTSGNVGIGTTSPQDKLHVYDGTAAVGNAGIRAEGYVGGYGAGIEAGSQLIGGSYLAMGKAVWDGESSWNTTVSTQDSYFSLHTTENGTLGEKLRVTSSGNVGIGNTVPGAKLEVTGPSSSPNNALFVTTNSWSLTSSGSAVRIGTGATSGNTYGVLDALTSGGSATGVLAINPIGGNVGIGTTNPLAKFDVASGAIFLSNSYYAGALPASSVTPLTGEIRGGENAASSYGFLRLSAGSTVGEQSAIDIVGYNSLATDAQLIRFLTSGNERMRVTQSGNVGIGTASPANKFQVYTTTGQTAHFGGQGLGVTSTNYTGISFGYGEAGPTYQKSAIVQEQVGDGAARGTIHILNDGTNDSSNATLADARLSITYAGNVGIGTTTPAGKLHLYQTSGGTNTLTLDTNFGSGNAYALNPFITSVSNGGFEIRDVTNGTSRIVIQNTTGNVGIGTTTPAATLGVAGGIYSTGLVRGGTFQVLASGYIAGTSNLDLYGDLSSGSSLRVTTAGNAGIANNKFFTGQNTSGTAMTLAGVGGDNVLYYGDTGVSENLRFTNNAGYIYLKTDGNVGIGTTNPGQKLDVAGTVRQTGGVNCALSSNASGDIICTSDANLKENIAPFADGLSIIKGIDPSYFQYKGEHYTHVGFIAQNVRAVLPAATPLQNNGFLGLDSNAILAAVVNAIKELSNHLDGLQATVLGFSDRFTTKTLCVGETCVTEDELKALLQNANINVAASVAQSVPEETTQATTTPEIIEVGASATSTEEISVPSTEATSTETTSTEATSTPAVVVPPEPIVLVQEEETGQIHMSETVFTTTLPSSEVPTSQYISL